MKMPARFRRLVGTAIPLLLAVVGFAAASAHAGFVTWSAPQPITGDADISTDGTLVVAHNLGTSGNVTAFINGVTFTPFGTNAAVNNSGNVTVSAATPMSGDNTVFGEIVSPFVDLSPDYQALLQSGSFSAGPTPAPSVTLTLAGLALGMDYQFQWWVNQTPPSNFDPNSPPPGLPTTTATAGNSVTLQRSSFDPGTIGQFAIGVFTATAFTQTIVFQGSDDKTLLNAFQLRQLAPTAIPEPGSCLFGLAMSAVIFRRIFTRRRPSASIHSTL